MHRDARSVTLSLGFSVCRYRCFPLWPGMRFFFMSWGNGDYAYPDHREPTYRLLLASYEEYNGFADRPSASSPGAASRPNA